MRDEDGGDEHACRGRKSRGFGREALSLARTFSRVACGWRREKAGRKKSRLCVNLHLEGALDFNPRGFSPEAHHLTYHGPTGTDAGLVVVLSFLLKEKSQTGFPQTRISGGDSVLQSTTEWRDG